MNTLQALTSGAALALALASPLVAQQRAPATRQATAKPQAMHKPVASATKPSVTEERPGLLARAAVKPDSARTIALHEMPSARFTSQSIRERSGHLTYVFRLKRAKGASRDVMVDAMTGAVIPTPVPSKATPKKSGAHAKGKGR